MTQMPADLMRGSTLMGVDVYGTDNQKIGDIDEVLIDRQGKIHGVVVGVGGFLGIGEKDVAIPFDQVQWMSNREVQASTGTAGTGHEHRGRRDHTGRPAAGGSNQPATTGSTGAAGTAGTTSTAGAAGDDNVPARAVVKMTKADLQNAPEFRYNSDTSRANTGSARTRARRLPAPAGRHRAAAVAAPA